MKFNQRNAGKQMKILHGTSLACLIFRNVRPGNGWSAPSSSLRKNTTSRRRWIVQQSLLIGGQLLYPHLALADSSDPVQDIKDARDTLQTLLDNWERAVIDCTYADVPRDLLESKNKDKLLEKASTFALFDKSVAVVSCKTTNRLVRDYIGSTGKGPVVALEKKLRAALPLVEGDMDLYVSVTEEISQNLSKAKSLSYSAGVADFASVNNFDEKDIPAVLASNSNLEQTRETVSLVVKGLEQIIPLF